LAPEGEIAVRAEQLHVVTARFNPLRWEAPDRNFRLWVEHILDSGAKLTVAEVQYGRREFACDLAHVNHVGLRAESWVWSKECALNLAIQRIPEAEYVAWGDADIWHRRADWASETVEHLQHYRVLQTWTNALDLGPRDELLAVHKSFCSQYMNGAPLVVGGAKFWKFDGGYVDYPHSGYFWACRREFLDWTGGLFEYAGMGSADHHMALALVGQAEKSWPEFTAASYKNHLQRWQSRARAYVNGRICALPGTIEHRFHGAKQNRGYLGRWQMFMRHGFDPDADLKRNSHGVLEWAGNKPELEREWDLYLRSRREDDNCV
jgi:hypothetical protein